MRDGNADPLAGPGQLETTEHAIQHGDTDVPSAGRTSGSGRPADGVGDDDNGSERNPDEHASIRMNDRCATCNEYIGPRAYRLSRVIDTSVATLEIHYCSEACFLERDRPADSSGSDHRPDGNSTGGESRGERGSSSAATDTQPRDWSYCR